MIRTSFFCITLCALSLSDGNLRAQAYLCPDQVTVDKPTSVVYGPDLGCGGLNVDMGGVQLDGTSKNCPSFAVIVPAHASTSRSRNSNTYTMPLQTIRITRLDFACKTRWFLIFPIGSECRRIALFKMLRIGEHVEIQIRPRRKDAM